jgi:hypothetical protein
VPSFGLPGRCCCTTDTGPGLSDAAARETSEVPGTGREVEMRSSEAILPSQAMTSGANAVKLNLGPEKHSQPAFGNSTGVSHRARRGKP